MRASSRHEDANPLDGDRVSIAMSVLTSCAIPSMGLCADPPYTGRGRTRRRDLGHERVKGRPRGVYPLKTAIKRIIHPVPMGPDPWPAPRGPTARRPGDG